MSKRLPNWTLCIKNGPDGKWQSIGAAWETEKGNLFLKLDEGVEVVHHPDSTLMLFPYREKPKNSGGWNKRPYRPEPPQRREPYVPPSKPEPPPPFEPDYMQRKREERRNPSQPPPPQPVDTDLPCEDPREPDWL